MRRKLLEHCDVCGKDLFAFLFDHHNNWKVQRCVTCGLVQVIPRPTEKEVASLYHEDFEHFEPYLAQLSVHKAYFHHKMAEIVKMLEKNGTERKGSKTLMDVGCAMGVLLEEAKQVGFEPYGVDISKDAAEFCKKQGFHAVHGTVRSYHESHETKHFDVVTGFEVIEHEYSPRAMVETMYKMVKKGGIAVVTTPNYASRWREVMGKYWPGYQHPEHLFFFDPDALRYLFTDVGFSEVKVLHDENRPFPLSFLFSRASDYFPAFAPILKTLGALTKPLPLVNPLNPWDDLIVLARK
jgi:2-polyprenyl-3-methyl-5-hydroxy-6-metoxy-1,4-benzoquinol methylase